MFKKSNSKEVYSLLNNDLVKVVIIGCIAIVVALLFMSFTSMMITRNAVVKKLKSSDLQNMAESISSVIEGRIEKAVDASLLMANDPTVIKWVQNENTDTESGLIVAQKMNSLVTDFGYNTSFLASNVTKNYWSFHGTKFELLYVLSKDDPNDDWFFSTLNLQKKYQININYDKGLKDTYVWINTLVGDTQKPIALTGLGMNLSTVIKELVAEETPGEVQNSIWLVDGQGVIYLSKNPEYLNKNLSEYMPLTLSNKISNTDYPRNKFKIAEYQRKNGEIYDIAYKQIKDTDWKLIVQIPRSESVTFIKAIAVYTVLSCFIIILIMVFLFYWLSNRIANPYNRALLLNEELERKVNERTQELQEKNTKIQDSIEYAKMIQQTILPADSELKRIMKDYCLISEPRDIVGGDFYWIRHYDEDFLLVVGDCTGHGVPGALMTTAVNAMLNHIVDELELHDPATILSELDRLIKQSFRNEDQGESIQYGLDAGILYVSKTSGILFSGAGISVIIADQKDVREVKGSTSTIDSVNRIRKNPFENFKIAYQSGIELFIATDGITDQPGGDKQLPYGKNRLITSINQAIDLEMDQQALYIQQCFQDYAAEEMRRDDITLLGFRL